MSHESPCARHRNSNVWKMWIDPNASPPTSVAFPPGKCQMSCGEDNVQCVMECSDDTSGNVWTYDGYVTHGPSARLCPEGDRGTACWHRGLDDVDPKTNILSQVNDSQEPPLIYTWQTAKPPQLWIPFAASGAWLAPPPASDEFSCSAPH